MDKPSSEPKAGNSELAPHYSGYGMVSASDESRTAPSDLLVEAQQQPKTVPEKRQTKVAHTLFTWSLVFWSLNILSVLAAVAQFAYVKMTPVDHPDYRGMWILLLYFTAPLLMGLSGLLSLIGMMISLTAKDRDPATRRWVTWNAVSLAAAVVILILYLSWFIPTMS